MFDRRSLLATMAVVAGSGKTPALAAGDDLLARVARARGRPLGDEVMVQRGRLSSARRQLDAPVLRILEPPDRLRIEIRYPSESVELRLLDGRTASQNGKPVPPMMRLAMLAQAYRIGLPDVAIAHPSTRPLDPSGGLARFETVPEPGLRLIMEIDPANRRVHRSRGLVEMPGGKTVEFAAEYSEYALFGGRLIARNEAQFAMGGFIGTTRIDEVEFETSVPSSTFRA